MAAKKKSSRQAQAAHYFEVFQRSAAGTLVFEDMWLMFCDRSSHVPGDPYTTAFNEGQRAVLLYIAQKCAEAQG